MDASTPPLEADPTQPDPTQPDADPVAVAREIALRQLTVRARTRTELARALAKRKVPTEVAQTVLDRLTEVGLIDDAMFARDWLESGSRRNKSRRALAVELSEKGVARDIIDQALAELESDTDHLVALAFAERKARSLRGLDHQVAYRRLAGALARRGFAASVVAEVVREVLAQDDDQALLIDDDPA